MKIKISGVILLLVFSFIPLSHADGEPPQHAGKKFRIGYYEGGPYSEYTDTMKMFIHGLIKLGWIQETSIPEFNEETPSAYWDWLTKCKSPYLSFKNADGYSALWDSSKRSAAREDILKKLKANSLDLVIAMGTWAGLDLANNEHSTPVLVMSTSNPIEAGIIKSADDSGNDHVTARIDSSRYLRQIRMFHRITGFKTLGVAYEDTPDGRLYSAVKEVKQIARERGFKTVFCKVNDTTPEIEKSNASCLACYRKLAKTTDAVYITALACVDRQAEVIAEEFRKHRIPSFSMTGSKFVQKGFLLSISSDSGYKALGEYNAIKFGEILNGTSPRDLKQVFEDPLEVAVNMKTAQSIGFKIPESILKIATEVYK